MGVKVLNNGSDVSTIPVFDNGLDETCTVVWLKANAEINPSSFGWKAANLCRWSNVLARVLKGFAISCSIVAQVAQDELTECDLAELENAWAKLTTSCPSSTVIVRSSSSIEHSHTNSFAGLFVTVRDVASFDGLIAAIRKCHASASASNVRRYNALRGTSIPDEHMAVIVQQQIQVRYTGLLHVTNDGYLFEGYGGDLSHHICGLGLPEDVVRLRGGVMTVLRVSNRMPGGFFQDLGRLISEIRIAADNNSGECLLEVAWYEDRLYIFQINLVASHDGLNRKFPALVLDVRDTVLEDDAGTLGLKAAAMKYFHASGLFGLPVWVFPPETSAEDIRGRLKQDPRAEGYTVRYSNTGELGLPRSFRADINAVVEWVLESRQPSWSTIVHPYIAVKHSFEMLLTGDHILIEHVAGMWESDNNADPDVLSIRGGWVRGQISTDTKSARFSAPDGLIEQVVSPVSTLELQSWAERAEGASHLLRRDFAAALPINIHFVEDAQKRWFFLNVRQGFELDDVDVADAEPHVVQSVSDLNSWDRQSPILLRFTPDRGTENRVIEIAEYLWRYRKLPILIDFGVLSHPALILREFGFTLVPMYLHKGRRCSSPSYQSFDWHLDHGDEPIIRIRREPYLYADEWVRVVKDRQPIVPGHLLVVAEECINSFADSNAISSLLSLVRGEAACLPSGPWILVERGRAHFCTSGFTSSHAHSHLLPAVRFKQCAVDSFGADLGATRYDSLEEALEAARRCSGEYALAATSGGSAYVCALPDGKSFEKRRIRNFFGGLIR